MEIDAVHLILYFAVWTIFYFYLSHYIAELSRRRWTQWIQSEDSDEVLMEALEVIVSEIEDRMHDKLEQFQSSFFGSLGAASKKLDNATGQATIKALTKDNPMMGFVAEYLMKRGGVDQFIGQNTPNNVSEKPKDSKKLGLE
jgi:5'-3' exonuclease